MLVRLAKFGIYAAFAVTAGLYVMRGAGAPDYDVDTGPSVIEPPAAGMVIPGPDGRDYAVGGVDVSNPPPPERENPLQPGTDTTVAEGERLDEVLTNGQVNALQGCFTAYEDRLDRVGAKDAFYEATPEIFRLLNQDGLELRPRTTSIRCSDFVNTVVNEIASVAEGVCRPVALTFNQESQPARLVDIQFCRDPANGKLIVGPAGVTLRP